MSERDLDTYADGWADREEEQQANAYAGAFCEHPRVPGLVCPVSEAHLLREKCGSTYVTNAYVRVLRESEADDSLEPFTEVWPMTKEEFDRCFFMKPAHPEA